MHFVTDSGTDISLTAEQLRDLNIHIVPLKVSLDGDTFREGVDIEPADFYRRLSATESLPAYLERRGCVAIADIDTRRLTRRLGANGAQGGAIVAGTGS